MNPTQRETDPAPSVYVQIVEKFAMVKVHLADVMPALEFTVEVAATLKDASANLSTIERLSKLEVIVIFSYNTPRESFYIWLADVSTVNVCILREDNNQEEDMFVP